MPSNFQVVDATFNLIYSGSGPLVRAILSFPMRAAGGVVLTMSVKTGYSDITKSASVLMNGTVIGKIDPRPWVNHEQVDMEAVTFIAPVSTVTVFPIPLPQFVAGEGQGINFLEIMLGSSDDDGYVFVENIVCHYHE